MSRIEFSGGNVEVDAGLLAQALRIEEEALKLGMRDGTITSRFERGEDEDAGRFRLTFYSAERRVRMIVDATGTVLKSSTVKIGERPAVPRLAASATVRPDGGDRAARDALLDMANEGSFPASDPIAIDVAPRRGTD